MIYPTYQGSFSAGKCGNRRGWNKELHFSRGGVPCFQADSLYIVSGYVYRTDGSARVDKVKGVLRLKKADRNGNQQKIVRKLVRASGDHAGHLVGTQFDGTGDGINLVSMNSKVNAYMSGDYGKLEAIWAAALKRESTVSIVLELYYEATRRPCGIDVHYFIDGTYHHKYIENPE